MNTIIIICIVLLWYHLAAKLLVVPGFVNSHLLRLEGLKTKLMELLRKKPYLANDETFKHVQGLVDFTEKNHHLINVWTLIRGIMNIRGNRNSAAVNTIQKELSKTSNGELKTIFNQWGDILISICIIRFLNWPITIIAVIAVYPIYFVGNKFHMFGKQTTTFWNNCKLNVSSTFVNCALT